MISSIIKAANENDHYVVPVELGETFLIAEFDTGAGTTIISLDVFTGKIADEKREKIKDFFSQKSVLAEEFRSASGDSIYGYPVYADGAVIGGVSFPSFTYYLIVENKRSLALIGHDFIDHCQFSHKFGDDIIIDDFDFNTFCRFLF